MLCLLLTDVQVAITFFQLEISPTMYILRESSCDEDFKNQKFFEFLMLFCIQNGKSRKWWKIRFSRIFTKMYGFSDWGSIKCAIFVWKDFRGQKIRIYDFYAFLWPKRYFLGQKIFDPQVKKSKKLKILIFLNFDPE